ncbi:DUF2184 domain-containing protein [Xanthomonas arboricola pv. corylina]|uniref:DUF2184 domain-containing protein n=1 Tax=Xanthomonas arboricola TaxID=56448 RepID=UPI0025B10A07|nr:major capsid family protein [Xanthomonas arboricola]MDN0202793.1 DUF2184 domain-containing protein [Xanthomonas arboricola pv. corylina]MDN0215346.1 DUF2184 domain-containing protein [Xanthomonas arboricola pv. corylina]
MRAHPLFDAQVVMGFVVSQTTIIEPGVYRTVYPDIQYRDLVPVDTSGSEFATSVTYYSQDQYGKADWINGNADDIPKAGTNRSQFQTGVHTAGIGYGYGWEEVGRAQLLGINLSNEDAAAARRASEEMVDRVALLGDASKGFSGLFNAAGVTPVAAPTGAWGTLQASGTATSDQIVGDMNAALINVFNGTNTTAIADRLLLPWSKYMLISTKKMSEYSDLTVLQYFLANNVYTATTRQPLDVRGLRGLDNAGVGNVARMVAYRYDANVLKLHMPMPHRFLPVYQSGPLRWDVPGVMRLGGLDVRLPKQVVYVDGI